MAEFTLKPTLVSGKLAVHDFNGYEYKQGGSILCENTMARVVSTDNGGVYFYSLDESESGKVTLRLRVDQIRGKADG